MSPLQNNPSAPRTTLLAGSRRGRRPRLAVAAALALSLTAAACSDKAGPTTGAGTGTGTGTATTAATSAATLPAPITTTTATATATAQAPSCAIDEAQYADWDDFGKACNYAVPKTPGALPPRVQWEACGPAIGLSGCKKLKVRAGAAVHHVHAGAKRPDVIEIGFVEECVTDTSKHALLVLAEGDGPTLAAFASKGHEPGKCDVALTSLHQGAYTARLTESGDGGPGAFVGAPTQTSKPALLLAWEPGHADKGAVASDLRWIVYGPNGAKTARWTDPAPEFLTKNALNVEPALHHDEIFWADADMFVVKAANKVEKLRPSESGDSATALGTDGAHLVFFHKPAAEGGQITLAASPYTTEPDKLSPTAVLPLARRLDSTPWTVGCGYAAHQTSGNEVLIARLRDGTSWELASKGCDTGGLCFQRPLALTCTEVYLAAATKDGAQESIVRVTFAGLGKGKPPAAPPAPLAAPATSAAPSAEPTAAPSAEPTGAPAPAK